MYRFVGSEWQTRWPWKFAFPFSNWRMLHRIAAARAWPVHDVGIPLLYNCTLFRRSITLLQRQLTDSVEQRDIFIHSLIRTVTHSKERSRAGHWTPVSPVECRNGVLEDCPWPYWGHSKDKNMRTWPQRGWLWPCLQLPWHWLSQQHLLQLSGPDLRPQWSYYASEQAGQNTAMQISFSSVQFDSLLNAKVLRGCIGLLEEVGFRPHRNCPLEMEGEWAWVIWKCSSWPVWQCGSYCTFAKFCRCSPHCQVTTLYRPETDTARVAIGTQTCCKYAGPVPWTQLKAHTHTVTDGTDHFIAYIGYRKRGIMTDCAIIHCVSKKRQWRSTL